LVGIERAAGEESLSDFDGGHFAKAVVDLEDQVLGIRFFVDIHFDEAYATIAEKLLGAAAVDTPVRAVHRNFFHVYSMVLRRPAIQGAV
jgi:hypothetical protein